MTAPTAPTPAAPPTTVTLTIEGRQVTVPMGTSILEAAKAAGVLIPHYCYHPGLPVAGVCRMCLVEVEKAPKLAPSCATSVAEGQVVHVHSEKALDRKSTRLNSSHSQISYAVFCLKKKKKKKKKKQQN